MPPHIIVWNGGAPTSTPPCFSPVIPTVGNEDVLTQSWVPIAWLGAYDYDALSYV
ncbi:hypothetical protein SISNIDRAFT_456212 [Sistotremastrum niveocremeum HHB9708]|uniref:Uncharacterized protein n=2 Tax=Sistotremastraceae TaxID=3402574 RepID=A0A164T257_9AGAM|nr:hypothetical protein SISNIDRAFT_456212 [Sistotremastrum niveocremeum HHB9708]KZT38849.1 hypothetical protein SISSUDRAFT_1046464 [Sistotremastrum suecicum HHB10207 ss-3]